MLFRSSNLSAERATAGSSCLFASRTETRTRKVSEHSVVSKHELHADLTITASSSVADSRVLVSVALGVLRQREEKCDELAEVRSVGVFAKQ